MRHLAISFVLVAACSHQMEDSPRREGTLADPPEGAPKAKLLGGSEALEPSGSQSALPKSSNENAAPPTGSLDSAAIAKVVKQRMRSVQECYERELARNNQLAGKVEIEFEIGESGDVAKAFVAHSTIPSDAVGTCITDRVRSWRFPKPAGGSVTVSFPFIFTTSGGNE